MSQIAGVLKKLENTSVYDILVKVEESYERISIEQCEWYKTTAFTCPSGCGLCCKGFEPDIFEGEALYMAAWLLENDYITAMKVADGKFPFMHDDGTCLFFNENSPYHCSIYNGRAFICRLFGASSFRSQKGEKVWRPCKFYPDEMLSSHVPPLNKRPYSESETESVLGAVPPLMSDLTEEARSLSDGETLLIHEILPQTIKRLLWIIDMNNNGNDNPNGTPSPAAA
ncbi:MAG: YkgJ family cysteine cluster protein [Treponema sp.]|nr:YkgJ family cysteine cluster protein [Treponema sp.]